jgi:hypothetical protein
MAKSVVPTYVIKVIQGTRQEVAGLSYKEKEAMAVDWDTYSPREKMNMGLRWNHTMCTTGGYEVKDPKALERLLAK